MVTQDNYPQQQTCNMCLFAEAPPVARIRDEGPMLYPSFLAWLYLAKNCPSITDRTLAAGGISGTTVLSLKWNIPCAPGVISLIGK